MTVPGASSQRATHDVSRWKSERAAARFRALYADAAAGMLRELEQAGSPRGEVIELESRFGTTHAVHWAGSGRPLVLLHGHNGSWLSWAPLLRALAGRDVYAMDTVGEPGGSIQTSPITSASDLVSWLREAIERLGVRRPVIVGMSYGGWIAAHVAAAHPELVSALVLVEPAIGSVTMKRVLRQAVLITAAQLSPPPLRRWTARRIDAEPLVYDWRLRKPAAFAFRRFDRRIPAYAKLDDPTPDSVLASIKAPTLLLLGGRSELHDVDAVATRARRLIPDLELHIVDRASHALPVTKPEEVAALLRPFLDRRGPID